MAIKERYFNCLLKECQHLKLKKEHLKDYQIAFERKEIDFRISLVRKVIHIIFGCLKHKLEIIYKI